MIKITVEYKEKPTFEGLAQKAFAVLEQRIAGDMEKKLEGVQCPEHGTVPEVELYSEERGQYKVRLLNSCCPAFTEQCNQRFAAQ